MSALAKLRHPWRWVALFVIAGLLVALCGCRELAYYAQAIGGEHEILSNRKPIAKLIEDPQTSEDLKRQLELVQKLRSFAGEQLKLPVNSRYLKYVDLHRSYVVWNVQAAPQFSLRPRTWWYPLVGSLDYRGYFSEAGARACAGRIQAQGDDVYVDGIEAYSTLGWFNDPIMNTFVYRSEPELAEVIFHELGHARVFASGDTDFNEAYATSVGQEGVRRWLVAEGKTNQLLRYDAALRRNRQFVQIVQGARLQLEGIYGDALDEDGNIQSAAKPPSGVEEMLSRKKAVFEELRRSYAQLRSEWKVDLVYDAWFTNDLNNAQLNTIANYYDYLPAFERLLWLNGGDLERFYGAVQRLADMPKPERRRWLRELSRGAAGAP